jgi:serine/threonine protein phosphatase PrpC
MSVFTRNPSFLPSVDFRESRQTNHLIDPGEPETWVYERAPDHRFLLLATDGLWDVFSNREVSDFT